MEKVIGFLKNYKWEVALLLLVVFLLFLNISGRTFWMDETAVLLYLQAGPLQFILEYFKFPDNHPPLYYFLVLMVTKILPWNEVVIRLISVVSSVGIVAIVYRFLLELYNDRKIARLGAFFSAFSAYFVLIGQMARYHSLSAFLTLLVIFFLYRLLYKETSGKNFIYFIIFTILLGWTDYPHFIYTIVLVNFVYCYFFLKKKTTIKIISWLKGQLIILLSFLPMAYLLYNRIFFQGDGGFNKQNLLSNSIYSVLGALIFHIYSFFFSENILPWNYLFFIGGTAVLLFGLAGLYKLGKNKNSADLFLMFLFFYFIAANTLFLNFFNPRYNFIVYPKYVFVAYPLFVMLFCRSAYFLSGYYRKFVFLGWFSVALFGLVNFYSLNNYLNASYFSDFSNFKFVSDNSKTGDKLAINGDANIGVYEFYKNKYFKKVEPVSVTDFAKLESGTRVWFFATGSDDLTHSVTPESIIPSGFTIVDSRKIAPLDPALVMFKEKMLKRSSYDFKYSIFLLKKV